MELRKVDFNTFNIFRINNQTICLLCLESLSHETSRVSEEETSVSHFKSETHKLRVKSFLQECVSDLLNGSQDPKYVNVARSLVFDELFFHSTCFFQNNDSIICNLCSEVFFKTDSDCETLDNKIRFHLQSDPHLKTLKNCMFWKYFFNNNKDFVLISQSVVYCTFCMETCETSLHSLVNHLETKHGQDLKGREIENKKENHLGSIISKFETLNIVANVSDDEEYNLPQTLNCHKFSGNDLSKSLESIISKFETLNIGANVSDNEENNLPQPINFPTFSGNDPSKSNNDVAQSDIELSQSDTDSSQSDTDFSESDNYDEALEALTCPDCGEFVEIFNENAEFSLQFHAQKHRDLKSINWDTELEFNPNIDYRCPVCHQNIPIFNKNIELSVSRHFDERKDDHEGLGHERNDEARPDLITHVFSKLPETLKKYQNFLAMEEGKMFCKLCNCTIPDRDFDDISDSVRQHLCSSYHEGQFRSLSQDLALVVVDYNKQYQGNQIQQPPDLFETIVRKHPVIKNNREFIEKRSIHYFCKICEKHINHSPNEAMLTLNFILHLKGSHHKKSLKQRNTGLGASLTNLTVVKELKSKSNKTIKRTLFFLAQKSDALKLNKRYMRVEDGILSCIVCCQPIQVSRSGSQVISHCNSKAHNEVLTRNAHIYVSQSKQEKSTANMNKNIGNIQAALSELANTECFKPHITYLIMNKNGCNCIICNAVVTPTKNAIVKHICDPAHKKRAFSINQQVQGHTKHNATSVKQDKQQTGGITLKDSVSSKIQPSSLSQQKNLKTENVSLESNKKAKRSLHIMSAHSDVVRENLWRIEVKNGLFFCKICRETVKSTNGKHLINHLKSRDHKELLKHKNIL